MGKGFDMVEALLGHVYTGKYRRVALVYALV